MRLGVGGVEEEACFGGVEGFVGGRVWGFSG